MLSAWLPSDEPGDERCSRQRQDEAGHSARLLAPVAILAYLQGDAQVRVRMRPRT